MTKLSYEQIWDALLEDGYEAYLVGGAVRDIQMGLVPKDHDLVTSAKPGLIAVCIARRYPNAKIDYVGANFGVLIVDGIEVATYRADVCAEDGYAKNVNIKFIRSLEEDLARRDFTCNALALSRDGELIDPFGGLNDIKDRIIRFVGDPDKRIKEDANRIIRLCRFVARFDFEVHVETVEAIQRNLHLIQTINGERIRAEFLKAMEIPNASGFFGALFFCGVLEIILPELAACWFHTGGRHHQESVWDHNMLVGDAISTRFPLMKLSGYLHDIGKPEAFQKSVDGGFEDHHEIGADILEKRLKELRFSNHEVTFIAGLTRNHMRMVLESTKKSTRKTLKKLHECESTARDLIRIRIADHKSNINKVPYSISDIKQLVKSLEDPGTPFTVKELAVTGGTLIEEYCLPQDRIVSDLQKHLLQYVLNTGANDEDCLLLESQRYLEDVCFLRVKKILGE